MKTDKMKNKTEVKDHDKAGLLANKLVKALFDEGSQSGWACTRIAFMVDVQGTERSVSGFAKIPLAQFIADKLRDFGVADDDDDHDLASALKEVADLREVIRNGRADHSVDRVRADTLWRQRDAWMAHACQLMNSLVIGERSGVDFDDLNKAHEKLLLETGNARTDHSG